jgi:hypothetical protein
MRRVVSCLLFIAAFQSTLGHAVIGQESAKISDVGEWAWDLRDGETINRIFKYDGLLVSGGVLLQDYRDALAALKPSLQTDEYPSLLRTHRNPKDTDFGFLTVRTVYGWDRERGRVVYLQKVNGSFKVVGVAYWIE